VIKSALDIVSIFYVIKYIHVLIVRGVKYFKMLEGKVVLKHMDVWAHVPATTIFSFAESSLSDGDKICSGLCFNFLCY
jgi:hypothetical protein